MTVRITVAQLLARANGKLEGFATIAAKMEADAQKKEVKEVEEKEEE